MPLDGRMPKKQPPVNPPHVSLRSLRRATGLSLEQVCAAVTDITGAKTSVTRGTLSAIETGLRGPSRQMLDALAVAYGLDPGDITTDYEPRNRRSVEQVPA